MNIYIDESGSINNSLNSPSHYFIITLVYVKEPRKLRNVYSRFVSQNLEWLRELDQDHVNAGGHIIREGGKMFRDGNFRELKGSQFDRDMRLKFLDYFTRRPHFELFYIVMDNQQLSPAFCSNTARCFNYVIRLALSYWIKNGLLPNEDCHLQIDERNESTRTRFFLEDYLNTELCLNDGFTGPFKVTYFDSADNKLIQIADVFSNLYYSELKTGGYSANFNKLRDDGFLKYTFEFPLR